MKIFYSWQLDAPRKINKEFIRESLNGAVNRLSHELSISEPQRDDISIDQDTQGVLGSPDIARVILEKIALSDVVVADVTLIATGKGDKKHMNSNVAIELGYAYGKIGDEAVLKVMNTHYGPPNELPFDLRMRRFPVLYCLPPDADAQTIASEQKKLVRQLVEILKLYADAPASSIDTGHTEIPSTKKRGFYWLAHEIIIPKRDRYVQNDIFCHAPSVIYFRCIPEVQLPELTSSAAYEATNNLYPLLSEGGFNRSRNKWGAVSSCCTNDREIMGLSQVFKNGEIWGCDTYYSNVETNPEDEDEQAVRVIPTGAINRDYPRALNSIRKAAEKLYNGRSYIVEMGVSGASDLHLAIGSHYWDGLPGPIFDDDVYVRLRVTKDFATGQIMNAFWEKLFAEAGRVVPSDLVWSTTS